MDIIKKLEHLKDNFCEDELSETCKSTNTFIEENEKVFKLDHIILEEQKLLFQHVFDTLNIADKTNISLPQYRILCLHCIKIARILSRERELILNNTNLEVYLERYLELFSSSKDEDELRIEILKCFCNMVYHSPEVRQYFIRNNMTSFVLKNINERIENGLDDILFFSVRIIFLMSAFESSERTFMLEKKVVQIMTVILEKGLELDIVNTSLPSNSQKLMSEVLKALFNITLEVHHNLSKEIEEECAVLTSILYQIILKYAPFNSEQLNELLVNVAHMLVNIPKSGIVKLLGVSYRKGREDEDIPERENMAIVDILLDALDKRMQLKSYNPMKENSMAILTSFSYICRVNSDIRKYLRKVLLPSYKPSFTRPEEDNTTTGRIIKLMTTLDVPLKIMAADFLFVLCKENTARLIRYCGYGNSAGYLASKGLMIPGMTHTEGIYSDDELTDVDDDVVDQVTGAKRQEPSFDFNSLTEQEKEAEADKLMCMIDRLSELNVIKPMKVDEDGKLAEMNKPNNADDNDSD